MPAIRKVRPYNENYFSVPNVENSYWAGFMATDGSMGNGKFKNLNLVMTLALSDREAIDDFCKCIKYTGKVKTYKAEYLNKNISTIRDNYGRDRPVIAKKDIHAVYMFSTKLCCDLWTNFNITPRKTFTLKPPKITEEDQIKAFLCGVIDGDGSITYTDKSNLQFGITSASEDFINWCNQILSSIGDVDPCKIYIRYNKYYQTNTYVIGFNQPKAYKILNELDTVDIPKLDRKWSKLIKWREDKGLLLPN